MTTTSLTTELEAVNMMLVACEEAPVTSLALSGLWPLDNAKNILSETARTVQSPGWKFNSEDCFPLTRDGSSNVPVPANVLRFDADDYTDIDPVQRGSRMYDAKNHTYVFPRDLKGTVVVCLAWDDLPQPARQYIAIRAARTMQGRSALSEAAYRYTAEDEQTALLALSDHEAEVGDHNMLRDSWSVASVLFDREMQ